MATITGTDGNDNLNGGSGADTINGGDGNDKISGGSGSDILNGGSGNDIVNGDSGDDILIYRLSENGGSSDIYTGGSGIDTVRLMLTTDEWLNASVQTQIGQYLQHLAAVTNAKTMEVTNGLASDFTFNFISVAGTKTMLTIQMTEKLDVWVNEAQINFHRINITSAEQKGAVVEDAVSAATGTIMFTDVDLAQNHTATFAAAAGNTTTLGTFTTAPVSEGANAANGSVGWTYTLDNNAAQHLAAGQAVTENYIVTVRDDAGLTTTQNVVITITGTNDGPVAVADVAAGTENQTLTIDVLANDTDVDDGHVFTLVSGAAPQGKGVASVAANQLVFTPGTDFDHLAAGITEQVEVSYTMEDEHGAQSTSTATITITGTNDGPVAVADVAESTENQTLTIDVLANDTDVDDGHVFTLVSGAAPQNKGVASVDGNKLVFTPGTDFDHLAAGVKETVVVSYTMEDEHGAQSTSTATITITGTNDGPVAVADVAESTENQTLTIDVLANDTDVDDDHVFTLVSGAAPQNKGVASVDGNKLVFTPGTDFDHLAAGVKETVVVSYTMEDEHGAQSTSTATITITGTNDGPVAVADVAESTENQTLTIDVLANDTDVDDDHVFTLVSGAAPQNKGVASVDGNKLVFTPGTDFDHLAAGVKETVVVSYTMADEHGAQSTSTATITITGTNDGPVAVADVAESTENQTLTIDVLANDTDVDDDHVFTLVSGAAPQNKGVASVDGNKLVFTPGTDFDHLAAGVKETVVVSYTMEDEHGAQSTSTATITITGTNDGPVAVADVAESTENQTLTIDVLANDTDVDDDHVFTLVSGAAPQNKGVASVDGNKLVFTPGTDFDHLAAGVKETVVVSYTMADEHGAQSTSTATITVTGTNDGPVAVADVAESTENQTLTIDVLANDTDVDDGHVFTLVSGAAPQNKGVASVDGNKLVFTPGTDFDHLAAGVKETVVVSYTMADEHGAQSTSTATITITGTNDGPVAVADVAESTENQTLTIDVLANDTDVDDGHVFTLVSGAAPQGKGVASVAANQLVFTPGTDFDHLAAGITEQVEVSYTMEDEHGAQSTSTATITVTGTNDLPVVSGAVTGTVTEDGAASTLNALANASDIDAGTNLAVVNVQASLPAGVSYNAVNKTFALDPANAAFQSLGQGQTTTVTANYGVSDGTATTQASVSWTVTGINDTAVIGTPSVASVKEDVSVNGSGNLTALGSISISDADQGQASFKTTVNSAQSNLGSLVLAADGSYTYTVANDKVQYLGAADSKLETFTVTALDGTTKTVSFTINGSNDQPTVTAGAQSVQLVEAGVGTAGTATASITLTKGDADTGDTVVYDGTALIANGWAIANGGTTYTKTGTYGTATLTTASGVVSYVLDNADTDTNNLAGGAAASDNFTVYVKDGSTGTASTPVNFAITGTTDAPAGDVTAPTASIRHALDSSGQKSTFTIQAADAGGIASVQIYDTVPGAAPVLIYTFSAAELTAGSTSGTYTHTFEDGTTPFNSIDNKVHQISARVTDNAGNTATAVDAVTFSTNGGSGNSTKFTAPAGIAGEPINLGLIHPVADGDAVVVVQVKDVPAGWTINGATQQADGSWIVKTTDLSLLTVTTPASFSGAAVLNVTATWTQADGTTATMTVADNVEAYAPGSPIFAISDDDNLTASSAADLLVFAQPIAHDIVHNFDATHDKIDLIGFTGVTGFANLAIADDANGNAVITTGAGSTITVRGVHAADLSAANFEFNVEPVITNNGTMTVFNGAILPLGGVVENTGTIVLGSTGSETRLQVLVESVKLQGHGHVQLSDDANNVIFGGASNAKLINIDNTISGAGQIGAGQMTLENHAAIIADGSHALVIDTGANIVANAGTLEATGAGGLVVESGIANDGKLWANGGNITVHGDVTGAGSALISGSAALELDGAAHVAVSFADNGAGTLKLGDADHFSGSIAGFGDGDSIDLTDVGFGANTTLSYLTDTAGSGTLIIGDGAATARLALQGAYGNAGFHAVQDQSGGTVLTVNATDANQHLQGGAGMDILVTGAGNDILAGGEGNDILFGGAGSDTFVFASAPNGTANVDTILDFNANGDADQILLSQLVFDSLTASGGTLDAAQFASVADGSGSSAALDAGVHVIYDSQTGNLYYDADGANTVGGRDLLAVLGTTSHPSVVDHNDIKIS